MNAAALTPTTGGSNKALDRKRANRLQLPLAQRRRSEKVPRLSYNEDGGDIPNPTRSPPISGESGCNGKGITNVSSHMAVVSPSPFAESNAFPSSAAVPVATATPRTTITTIVTTAKKRRGHPGRAIQQVCLTSGTIIQTYNSVSEAARQKSISRRGIRDVLSGKNPTAAGYYWRYESDQEEDETLLSEQLKQEDQRICCVGSRDSNCVVFDSVSDAAKATKVPVCIILKCLNGQIEKCVRFGWKRFTKEDTEQQRIKEEEVRAKDEEESEQKRIMKEEEYLRVAELKAKYDNESDDDDVCLNQDLSIAMERIYTRGFMTIHQISMENQSKIVATYSRVGKAAAAVGVTPETLYRCILGQTESCGGYYWQKEGEQDDTAMPVLEEKSPCASTVHDNENPLELSPSSKAEPPGSSPANVVAGKEARQCKGRGTIQQINLSTGMVDAEYPTVAMASKKVNVDRRLITEVVFGKRPTAGGYFWRKKLQSVQQISISTGMVVAEYSSANKAADALDIGRRSIRDVLSGKNVTAAGYFWRKK